MKTQHTLIIASALALMCSCSGPEKSETPAAAFYNDKVTEHKVDSLMKLMTLDEKIGQLVLFANNGVVTGAMQSTNSEDYIAKGLCGGVFNVRTKARTLELQKIAVEQSRLGIPLLFGYDAIHGFATCFPVNLGMSASWDIDKIQAAARMTAEESTAVGVNWHFSPMCDITHDPRWGRVSEGAGEDPYLGAAISSAFVRGYQGEDLKDQQTVLACVKHFAGYGAAQAGRDYHTVDMSERTFRDIYLPPYKAALDQGAATVMAAFNEFDGVPATGSKFLMQQLLREEIGFNGFVVSDYTGVLEMIPHGFAKGQKDAGLLALEAGCNMDMVSNIYLKYAAELVHEGKLSEKTIDDLCASILGMKFRLGLFDDPYKYCHQEESEHILTDEHLEHARKLGRSSMVLLENHNHVLPVKGHKKIALIGPFTDSRREMLGCWTIIQDTSKAMSFYDGLVERFGKENIINVLGCKPDRMIKGGYEAALAAARKSDIVFFTMGMPWNWTGEACSVTDIRVPEVQRNLLDALKATGKPVVVLVVTSRPLDLRHEKKLADAMLLTWHPGTMGGRALADVVSGDYTPSGKLSISFPYDIGQIPIHYNMKNTGRPVGSKKTRYTSKYLFTPNEPLYAFGYGKSYTEFEYSNIKVEKDVCKLGETVRVSANVRNIGDYTGEEVVQLYIRDLVGSVTRPVRELKGFKKLEFKPGEVKTVTFELSPEDLSFTRGDMTHGQEAGDYKVWIGGDSNAILEASFTLVN